MENKDGKADPTEQKNEIQPENKKKMKGRPAGVKKPVSNSPMPTSTRASAILARKNYELYESRSKRKPRKNAEEKSVKVSVKSKVKPNGKGAKEVADEVKVEDVKKNQKAVSKNNTIKSTSKRK
ncbi:hypothetical protein EDEG_03221 [Edhazardia aedis USNM 41457]|uniref:Uncharacterized protein n=1 Tax=Edhazardia aedis (strain USNM 41457) TaxID=1003232 RepID=J9D3C5_EDHAE|nr:hypothetical protein EDEG_03221 [Edhazardia aedis USNM 41457]|eukprot:EJW02346.1 hypothetical protein EDEG_03221 [Edhazardia aedis USNM 41457]